MHFMSVNLLGVLAAAIACMVIGFLWYSPVMFAKPWMALMGIDPNDKAKLDAMKKSAGPMYGIAFVCSLLAAFVMGKLFSVIMIPNMGVALKIGFAIWLGFIATVQLTGTLFGNRPTKLWLIETSYQLVCSLVTAALMFFFRIH